MVRATVVFSTTPWSIGVREWWSSGFRKTPSIPSLQYSITLLLARVAFRHFIEKTLFFQFLEETQIDELLRLGVFCLGKLRRDQVEHVLNALQRRVGLFG